MQQPGALSLDMLDRIRVLALRQAALLDELTVAFQAADTPRMVELVARLVDLEEQVKTQ